LPIAESFLSSPEVFQLIDTSVFKAAFVADSLKMMAGTVMKIGKEKYTQYDFARYVEKNQSRREDGNLKAYLNKQFKGFVDEMCLAYEDKNLENNYPEFRDLMQEYHDGILLFNLTDKEVWSKAVIDTVGLEKFFDDRRDQYMWEERVDATVYEIRDRDLAGKVKEIIMKYDSDGDIALALEQDSIKKLVNIKPGFYEKGDNEYVDQTGWETGLSDQINSDVENLVVFVKVRKILDPEPKKLDEARGLATADYQTYLEKQWIEELRKKYPVTVNDKVLQKLLTKQLNK